jgi:integrase
MISKAKLPEGKADHIEWNSAMPGFGIRTRTGGSRTYVVQYKIGKQNRRMTLGKAGGNKGLTLDDARREAKKVFGEVARGNDPQGAKKAARATASETFKAIADRFMAYQAKRLRPSSLYNTNLYLMGHCKRLHALKIESVTRRDIASVLSTINENSGAVSADRARAALSAMFSWAMKDGIVEANPVVGTNVYAGPSSRDRVLTPQEIAAIWKALPSNDYGTIVKLLFYTGARVDEVGLLAWSETNFDERQIELPAERSKNRRPFILPLSDPALKLLEAVERRDGRFVFGRRRSGFSGWSKSKAELDAKLKFEKLWQLRDIRRTVATSMADIGVQPHVVEACLNHVSGHKAGVAGIYNRAVYANEKRAAFKTWANELSIILAKASGANVEHLRRA